MSERLDKIEKMLAEVVKIQKETSNQMKKTDMERRKTEKERRKTQRKMQKETKDLRNELRWMWLTQWSISEDLIYDNFWTVFKEIWEDINSLERNIKISDKWKIKSEIDIIWVNWSKIFITESKTKLHIDHVDKLLKETIPNFKKYDRRHDGMKVFWVVWARVVPEKVKEYAKSKWLYVIKEYNNWNARILKESLKTVKSL